MEELRKDDHLAILSFFYLRLYDRCHLKDVRHMRGYIVYKDYFCKKD